MSTLLFKEFRPLAICLFISTLLLFPDVPIWCFALAMLFWAWRLFCHSFDFKIPSRTITGILSFLGFAVILLDFRTIMGKEPAASFIVILSGLKALEFSESSEKDFLVLLGFFLISSKFLFSYDLSYLLFSIPIYAVLTLNLFPHAWLKSRRPQALKYLFKVVMLAIPMAAMMFIFFPRITKTLLELPTSSRYGSTGFSDSVSPGSISSLSMNNEIAMRLEVYNKTISLADLYLAGLVLERSNNMAWVTYQKNEGLARSEIPIDVDYKIIQEPHYKNHIFALKNTDRMSAEGMGVYQDSNYTFRFDTYLEKKAFIQASISALRPKVSEQTIKRNTQSPDLTDLTPEQKKQISELIIKIKENKKTPEDISASLLNYFSNGRFNYTLNPGSQPHLSLHEFLFKSRKGYCEHFASAMALLFRLAGVPARVIIGYHGGEFNPVGNFWTIRQKDAHAWVEFLNSQSKWTAVDPVVVVAPQRIELGSNLYSSIVNDLLTEDEIKNRMRGGDAFTRLSMWFDNINYRWSSFLLEYDFDKQKDILRSLNLSLGSALIIVLLILFVISVAINLLQRRGLKRKFSELCFEEINNWAIRFNLQKKETEGPVSWQNRILAKLPESQRNAHSNLKKAFSLWIQLSYQQTIPDSEAKRSLTEIRRILKRT